MCANPGFSFEQSWNVGVPCFLHPYSFVSIVELLFSDFTSFSMLLNIPRPSNWVISAYALWLCQLSITGQAESHKAAGWWAQSPILTWGISGPVIAVWRSQFSWWVCFQGAGEGAYRCPAGGHTSTSRWRAPTGQGWVCREDMGSIWEACIQGFMGETQDCLSCLPPPPLSFTLNLKLISEP